MATLTRDDISRKIGDRRQELRRFGVRRLSLFGSFARGEATDSSDVDFLVDLDANTFDNYMGLKLFLEDLLDRKIDLVITRSLKPALRESVLREARDVA